MQKSQAENPTPIAPKPNNESESPTCQELLLIDDKFVPIDQGRLLRISKLLNGANEISFRLDDGLSFRLRKIDTFFQLKEETCGLVRQHIGNTLGRGLLVSINSSGQVHGTHNYVRVDYILGLALSQSQKKEIGNCLTHEGALW